MIFLGDGEFDEVDLQADLRRAGWQYVCRTATNILITAEGVQFPVGALAHQRREAWRSPRPG